MRSAVLALALAACSGPAKSIDAPLDNETGDDTIALAPCPDDAALLALAPRVWPQATEFTQLWCVALRVRGEPRWYLSGYGDVEIPGDSPDDDAPHQALVSTDGTAVWSRQYDNDERPLEIVGEPRARDLDGDGTDEILYAETVGEAAEAWTVLVVVQIDADENSQSSLQIGKHGCVADWDTEGRWFVVSGEGACAKYSGRFEWDGIFVD